MMVLGWACIVMSVLVFLCLATIVVNTRERGEPRGATFAERLHEMGKPDRSPQTVPLLLLISAALAFLGLWLTGAIGG